jgi:hypothetical protein
MEHNNQPQLLAESPLSKRLNETNNHENERESIDILLGVVLSVAAFFIFSMMYAAFPTSVENIE